MIYLDYAANTPVNKEVLDVFNEVSLEYIANPNSPHALGRLANARLEGCTAQLLELLNVQNSEVIYTSGATESNNLAIKGIAGKYKNYGRHMIATALEHSSVNGALAALQNDGCEVDYVDVEDGGLVSLDHLRSLLRKDTVLVTVCYVDSEAGVTQRIDEIAHLLKEYPNCRFHVDATQAIGKIPVALGQVDMFSFTPHKFYGLNGCGVLVKKEDVMLEPQVHGGISTSPYRSGSPALGLAAATVKAMELALTDMEKRHAYVSSLNRKLCASLGKYPKVKINSTGYSVPHILNISILGVKTEEFRLELERHEIYLSTRSACCAPNSISRPIYAITKDRKRAMSTLRISLSHLTSEEDIEDFLSCFKICYDKFAG